jgi:hypothetical protein
VVGDNTEVEKSQKLLTGIKICGMNKLKNEVQAAKYKPSYSTNKISLFNQLLLGPHFVHFVSLSFILIIATIFTLVSFIVLFSCRMSHCRMNHTVSVATVCMTVSYVSVVKGRF